MSAIGCGLTALPSGLADQRDLDGSNREFDGWRQPALLIQGQLQEIAFHATNGVHLVIALPLGVYRTVFADDVGFCEESEVNP
jgi:hypothetical protein